MDPVVFASMIFTLVVILMIGGFILLFPVTRQLARYVEKRLGDRDAPAADAEQIAALRDALHALEGEVATLAERQAFTESLVESRRLKEGAPRDAAPAGSGSVERLDG